MTDLPLRGGLPLRERRLLRRGGLPLRRRGGRRLLSSISLRLPRRLLLPVPLLQPQPPAPR
jgi:hypothetical protein